MHGGVGLIAAGLVIKKINKRALDDMATPAFRFLAIGACALKPPDPELEHEHVFIEQRSRQMRVVLLVIKRHPVMPVIQPQC